MPNHKIYSKTRTLSKQAEKTFIFAKTFKKTLKNFKKGVDKRGEDVLLYPSAEGRGPKPEIRNGRVVELVDSLDSGSSVHCGRAGSSPASPTMASVLTAFEKL